MSTSDAGGRSFAADPIVEAPGELPPVWAAQLVSCVVDENVALPDTAVLTYRDPDHEFLRATGITIGTPLRVSVVTVKGQARERLFNGEVTALEIDRDRTGSFTVVRAYSKAHRLQRGRKVVAYRNMTAAAIVRKVAAGAGLAVGAVEAAPVTYRQLSQANVSDWDFLQFLAGESGAQVRVDDKGLLQFTRPAKASGAPRPVDVGHAASDGAGVRAQPVGPAGGAVGGRRRGEGGGARLGRDHQAAPGRRAAGRGQRHGGPGGSVRRPPRGSGRRP
ncbi:contractile injection system protein, VgrG/Pvc8 family [Streptomyces showdoensis]|uniref:contractile injection system protein, VgrG/Pvc8 family n=1 Tax=Streptomyces showdoensis TaxID=68268 RepID=UPI00336D8851